MVISSDRPPVSPRDAKLLTLWTLVNQYPLKTLVVDLNLVKDIHTEHARKFI